MIEVEQALALVLERAQSLPSQQTPLDAARELILAEDVASDVDSPPHDKSLMDGYAVISADVNQQLIAGDQDHGVVLEVIEQVVAGATPTKRVREGTATKIMTGAPIPFGADAVVVVEKTEHLSPRQKDPPDQPDQVRIQPHPVAAGQNIMLRATSLSKGEVVLTTGTLLRPLEIGLLSEVGRTEIRAIRRPRVAVLSTGDELVDADQTPGAGQIRNSNGPMLCALADASGAEPIHLGIGRDNIEELSRRIAQGLEADVLVLSGGVSAGVLDLVPSVLADQGVEQVFHKVHLKPGKPIWFGVLAMENLDEHEARGGKLVFGLPGNPVSSLVCFYLFVRPALKKLAGRLEVCDEPFSAVLQHDHDHRGDRPTYFPAATLQKKSLREKGQSTHEQLPVKLVAWKGSADLRSLADADCLAYFPAGDRAFQKGDNVDAYWL